MIYLFIDKNYIKALYFKKSVFSQYDINFFEKQFQIGLIEKGKITNTDVLASAIKEVLTNLFPENVKEKNVVLILPQESFNFLRTEIPIDIAQTAVHSFIKDKIRSVLTINIDDYYCDYFCLQNINKNEVSVYALNKDLFRSYSDALLLLDLKVTNVVPDTVAYFKLFEKTLRKEKKENIFYVYSESEYLFYYLYDSFGLIDKDQVYTKIGEKIKSEEFLNKKAVELEKKGKKINRIILSGDESDKIRQDTFTKKVGVWTNPLKRIIANFYQDYLKALISPLTKKFSILKYDVCFGAFIFINENKTFSLLNNNFANKTNAKKPVFKKIKIKKEYLIFIVSFISSFILLTFISKLKITLKLPKMTTNIAPTTKPIPSPIPQTATPTPSFKREELNIKILNGGGVTGKASEVKDILKKAGYQEILTGNAERFDYSKTVIKLKKAKAELFNLFKNDLKEYTSSLKQEVLDENEKADVVIIVGQDFK